MEGRVVCDLNLLFRKRIGFSTNETITFEKLDSILEKTSKQIPFENLCIISNNTSELTKENLVNKILIKNEGGLCYDLNSLLYFFLLENGFDVSLVLGVVYNQSGQSWSTTGRTHVAILATHQNQTYLIDTGYGGNLPLKPVPLNGEVVTSSNGEFRVEREKTEHGDYIFYMKLKNKNEDWRVGYTFESTTLIDNISELNEIQQIIQEHPDSSFNKTPLITKLTDRGNITLTDSSFTEWINGSVEKKEITKDQFKKFAKEHFGIK